MVVNPKLIEEPNEKTLLEKITRVSLKDEEHLDYVLTVAGFTNSTKGRTSESSGLQIDTENILKVLQADSTRNIYTFEIENNPNTLSFSNLIIKELDFGYLAFVLRYEVEEEFTGMSNFTGKIKRFDLDGNLLSEKEMIEGHLATTRTGARVSQAAVCIQDIIVSTYCVEEGPGGDIPLARTHGAGNDIYCWDVVTVVTGPCSNNGGGGGGGASDGGGDTGGTYIPPSSGGGTSGGGSSGSGDSGGDEEIGVISSDPDLSAITNRNMLNSKQQALLSNTFNQLMNRSAVYQNMFDYLVKHNVKLDFKMNPNAGAPGGYNHETKTVEFRDNSAINTDVLAEELFHSFQDAFYPDGLGAITNNNNVGRSNIEFEAKLINDIVRVMNGEPCCMTVGGGDAANAAYNDWVVRIITNWGTTMPTDYQQIASDYFYYLEKFKIGNPMYNFPTDPILTPSSMFHLINQY